MEDYWFFPHIDEDWRYCEILCCCATAEWMTNTYYFVSILCWVPLPSPEGYRLCLEWHPRKYKNFEICIDYVILYCIPNIYIYTFWIKYLLTYLLMQGQRTIYCIHDSSLHSLSRGGVIAHKKRSCYFSRALNMFTRIKASAFNIRMFCKYELLSNYREIEWVFVNYSPWCSSNETYPLWQLRNVPCQVTASGHCTHT